MSRFVSILEKYSSLSKDPKRIRNIGISAHIDHGKTTLSDNLLLASKLISSNLAGKQLLLDFDEQEKARGITISSACSTFIFSLDSEDYIINLIDTPGHVDFGEDVTRAMRVLDGSIIVVAAVEGIMPQTETVIFQCLKERVKPILFINKIDRLFTELKEKKENMMKRFEKITGLFNEKIEEFSKSDPYIDSSWKVNILKGTVLFGSAFKKWAVDYESMKKNNFSFSDLFKVYEENKQELLPTKFPLFTCVLSAVVKHLPDPEKAQKYRIEKIWKGEGSLKEELLNLSNKGTTVFVCYKVLFDSLSNPLVLGRLYSGTISKSKELYLLKDTVSLQKIQNVYLCSGNEKQIIPVAYSGNLIGLYGLKNVYSGDTLCENKEATPFEEIKHHSQAVYTLSVRPKYSSNLGELLDALFALNKRDPALKIKINKETGEYLISGMGELHLETILYRLKHEYNLDIISSNPLVLYRETTKTVSEEIEGKSPNGHNLLFFKVGPLNTQLIDFLERGKLQGTFKKQPEDIQKLIALGLERAEAKRLMFIFGENLFIDATKGAQLLKEVSESMKHGFEEIVSSGPIMGEKLRGVKVLLTDVQIHVDNVHRGPAQIIPAMRRAIYKGILLSDKQILEPYCKTILFTEHSLISRLNQLVQEKRGTIVNTDLTSPLLKLEFIAPVSEMIGFSNEIRGITRGKAQWSIESETFHLLPEELTEEVVLKTRKRKGLPEKNIFYTI